VNVRDDAFRQAWIVQRLIEPDESLAQFVLRSLTCSQYVAQQPLLVRTQFG
jgi:hypothetical protein